MSIPTTAIKLIKNPISNKYSGLKSSIAIADIDMLESPSFLNPIDFANAAVKVIMLARTVEGEKSHSAQNINKKVDSIAIFAIRLVSFAFLKSQSNAPANIPTCNPDTANTCAVPVYEKPDFMFSSSPLLSPNVIAKRKPAVSLLVFE